MDRNRKINISLKGASNGLQTDLHSDQNYSTPAFNQLIARPGLNCWFLSQSGMFSH